MSKYNPKYHREWYIKNRDRLLIVRRKYNKEYFARPEVIEKERIKNARPEMKAYRKAYKKTGQGKESNKRYQQKNYDKRKEAVFKNRIKSLYGITPERYAELLEKQGNKCAICRTDKKRFHIDHCHKTGRVRGILCTSCNMGIGLLKDDQGLLKEAIKYLDGI